MWLCKYDLAKECNGKYRDCTDCVLDKIRAEIKEERRGYPPSADEYKTINKVLQIFDKYKAESEDKE